MKKIVLTLCRKVNRYLPMPYKVIFPFLYIMAYTVGVKLTVTIIFRAMKEIKALNLPKPRKGFK